MFIGVAKEKNETTISNSVLCLILVVSAASLGTAQDKSKSDTRTIAGCLSKGDNAKEFQLTGNDGSTWEVRSSQVDLSSHIGHTVGANRSCVQCRHA